MKSIYNDSVWNWRGVKFRDKTFCRGVAKTSQMPEKREKNETAKQCELLLRKVEESEELESGGNRMDCNVIAVLHKIYQDATIATNPV